MSNCNICKVQLDQPGLIETRDCGGDCLGCMSEAGDPGAGRLLLLEVKRLRKALGGLIADNAQLNEGMHSIHTLLTRGDTSAMPPRAAHAGRIAHNWVRLIDTPETNQPKGADHAKTHQS